MKHITKVQLLDEVARLRNRVQINRAASNKKAKTALLPFPQLYDLFYIEK